MNDLYLTCETSNCSRRAEPGRRYCVVCAHRAQFSLVAVRIPTGSKSMLAIINALVTSDTIIRSMRENVQRVKDGLPIRLHVGWWCHGCKSYAKDLMRPCACTTAIEDANNYFRFKTTNWSPCYAEVEVVR